MGQVGTPNPIQIDLKRHLKGMLKSSPLEGLLDASWAAPGRQKSTGCAAPAGAYGAVRGRSPPQNVIRGGCASSRLFEKAFPKMWHSVQTLQSTRR